MRNLRRQFDAVMKSKVALEAIKEEKSISEIASKYEIHPSQIRNWRKQLIESIPSIFSEKRKKEEVDRGELEAELYRQIGQLKVELDWLKKKYETFS